MRLSWSDNTLLIALSVCVCLLPALRLSVATARYNNLICEHAYTEHSAHTITTGSMEMAKRQGTARYWAVFLCSQLFLWVHIFFLSILPCSILDWVYRLLDHSLFFIFSKQFICIFVAIYCDFYSIIVDRRWIPQRQKNEHAHTTNEKDWYHTEDANVCSVHFIFGICVLLLLLSFFKCILILPHSVSLASIEVNPPPNTNLWSDIKQISLAVFVTIVEGMIETVDPDGWKQLVKKHS